MNGNLFRVLRKLNGDTQAAAAKRLQISQSTISKLESGVIHRLHRRHLSRIQRYALDAARVVLEPLGLRVEEP
ncbi:MAG TPA: helix-turn-helix transcriptional regulator [Candidatus Acidoferrales bacterium]|nr:helix-turn-helix transcriptional regulator [Candidatus Acidoferrales bacterium]